MQTNQCTDLARLLRAIAVNVDVLLERYGDQLPEYEALELELLGRTVRRLYVDSVRLDRPDATLS